MVIDMDNREQFERILTMQEAMIETANEHITADLLGSMTIIVTDCVEPDTGYKKIHVNTLGPQISELDRLRQMTELLRRALDQTSEALAAYERDVLGDAVSPSNRSN